MLWRCRADTSCTLEIYDSGTWQHILWMYTFVYFWILLVFVRFLDIWVHDNSPRTEYCMMKLIVVSHCLAPHMSNRWIPMFDRRSTGDRGSSSTADYDPHCGSGPLYGYRHGCWEWMKVIGVWNFLSGFCESLRKACQMTSDQELVYIENPWYFVNSRLDTYCNSARDAFL